MSDTSTMEVPVVAPQGRPRTPAEQADFDARVAAAAEAKRVEAEKAEVDAKAAEIHDARAKELADAQEADAKTQAERDAEQQRIAEHNAHPHTRLANLQKQMAAPGVLDINARVAMLHSVVAQLVQMIKEHTPAPNPPENTNGQGKQPEQYVERPVDQMSTGL